MLAFLVVFAWLFHSYFNVSFDWDKYTAYTANQRTDTGQDKLPNLLPLPPIEYKVNDSSVVSNLNGSVTEYKDCTIFDIKNWSCTYSDKSATIGVKDGVYYNRTNLTLFPHLGYLPPVVSMTRFQYIVLQCKWDFTEGIQAAMCLFRPFMT